MVKIGNFDLDEKPAIVSVIDDDPAENAKAAKLGWVQMFLS